MTTLTGILHWPQRTEGRVRQFDEALTEGPDDPFVPIQLGDDYPLRDGQEVTVEVVERKPRRRRTKSGRNAPRNSRPVVAEVIAIEGMDPADYADRKPFEDLSSIDPQPRLTLEYPGCPASCRLIDLFCPIGRGQRGLIVAPPKAGKTILLKDIAGSLSRNHPELEVFAMLIDERPEEVTDFRRTVDARVFASSNDHDVERHIQLDFRVVRRTV